MFKFIYLLKTSVLGEYAKSVLRSYEPTTKVLLVFFSENAKETISRPSSPKLRINPRYYHLCGNIHTVLNVLLYRLSVGCLSVYDSIIGRHKQSGMREY